MRPGAWSSTSWSGTSETSPDARNPARPWGAPSPSTPCSPPLTPAELDLFRELPSLRTVWEIAGALHLSVNTIKTHLRSMYRKLDVHGRRAAVEVARGHGLL